MKEKYLITGGAGHLGNTIVKQLLVQNQEVRVLVVPGEKNIPQGNIEIFYGDVRNKKSLESFFQGSEGFRTILIHSAGIVSIATKIDSLIYEVNVEGTKNIIDMSLEKKIDKIIYVSSVHAITEKPQGEIITETEDFDPEKVIGAYAKTKAEASRFVYGKIKEGYNINIVHPSGICGPYDHGKGHLTSLVIDYYKGRLTSGISGGYDFVDVRDVAQGIINCAQKGGKGECYILSNQYFKVAELLDLLHEITGKKRITRFLPYWFIKATAPLAELYYKVLHRPPLYSPYSIYTLTSNAHFSHDKATRELGYNNRAMKETLLDTVNWLKEQNRI